MSKKIRLSIDGKSRPSLTSLFKKYITRKMSDISKRTERYYELFPFLVQWGIDEEDAEMLLRYYGYIDKDGNVLTESSDTKKSTSIWDEDDYWDEYEEIYPGKNNNKDESEDIYSELYSDAESCWASLEAGGKKKGKGGKYKHTKGKKAKDKGEEGMLDITKPYSQGFIDEADDSLDAQYIYFYPDYKDKTDRLEFNDLKEFDNFCSVNSFVVPPYVGERIAYRPVSHCCLNPGVKERGIDEIMGAESYSDMYFEASEELQEAYR
jgi:hypothetical protein